MSIASNKDYISHRHGINKKLLKEVGFDQPKGECAEADGKEKPIGAVVIRGPKSIVTHQRHAKQLQKQDAGIHQADRTQGKAQVF